MKTAMAVLRARDWTMPRESCCRAVGKSWGGTKEPVRYGQAPQKPSQPSGTHSDTGVDGTDEEDGSKEDEDADVDSEHQRGAGER